MPLNLGATLNVGGKLVKIKRPLGSGAFGDVYKAKDKATGMKYALKDVVHQSEESEAAVKEIDILRQISIQFSPYAQGSGALQRIAVDAMQYNKNDRPSAEEIHNRITNIQGSVRLSNSGNQQASEGWCC